MSASQLKRKLTIYSCLATLMSILTLVAAYYHIDFYLFILLIVIEIFFMVKIYKINDTLETKHGIFL